VAPDIGELWRQLPADTRVPDHSIWSHLDVVSALAGALDGDSPALLTLSLGPVQGFIAQARSTSDLWAGSHLLSSLAWEGMKVIARALGPDALLFPHLRGVAAVDLWLLDEVPEHRRHVWMQRFGESGAEWLDTASDANPLFAATLPNKFMAIVPAARAEELAAGVAAAVRAAALHWATEAALRVFEEAGEDTGDAAFWRSQVSEQLAGFPEVNWSIAQWPLGTDARGLPDAAPLITALEPFYPQGTPKPGFFGTNVWALLGGEHAGPDGVRLPDGQAFFRPNAGLLYPAVHDLAERRLSAAKTLRDFGPLPQRGYRCSVSGEHEWLTNEPALLSGKRENTGVWRRLEGRFGIKRGERLGALATLKRLWPVLFADRVREVIGADEGDRLRYVISTHVMALATSMARALDAPGELRQRLEAEREGRLKGLARAALPRALHRRALGQLGWPGADALARVPSLLEDGTGLDDDSALAGAVASLLGGPKPETYYALLRMDGDNMGAWMSGTDERFLRAFSESWHPAVRESVTRRYGADPALAGTCALPGLSRRHGMPRSRGC
jgi:CRISPR-associated protein Cmr2